MSAATAPRFVDPGKTWFGQVDTANALLTGAGAVVTIVTAGTNGSLIELIRLKAIVATTAGMVRLFLNDGVNSRLYLEISVTAATPSGTVQAFSAEYRPSTPLVISSGWTLKASTANSEAINVIATGGDF